MTDVDMVPVRDPGGGKNDGEYYINVREPASIPKELLPRLITLKPATFPFHRQSYRILILVILIIN